MGRGAGRVTVSQGVLCVDMAARGGSPVTTDSTEYSRKKCSMNNRGNEPTDIGSEIVAESHDGVS